MALKNLMMADNGGGKASVKKNVQAAKPTVKQNNTVNKVEKATPVNTNINPNNLAGVNNTKIAVGDVKRNVDPVFGSPTKNNEQGKTFVPETSNKSNAFLTKKNLEQKNEALKSVADESNRKAQNTLVSIGNAFNNARKQVSDSIRESGAESQAAIKYNFLKKQREDAIQADEKTRNEILQSITDDDYRKFFDESGNAIDYNSRVNELNQQINGYRSLLESGLDESHELIVQNQLLNAENLLKESEDLLKKSTAYFENSNLESVKDDSEAYNSLKETFSHKNDNLSERFGNSMAHILSESANSIPAAIDELRYSGQTTTALQGVDELNALHETGQLSDQAYAEGLKFYNDEIENFRNQYNDSLSQEIRKASEQISENTYYGASDIEKFVLQTGESTASFLMHYAIATASVAAVTPLNLQAASVLGGKLGTVSMVMPGVTSKADNLIQEGYNPDVVMLNSALTMATSLITESVGMDRFVDMLGTDVSVNALGEIVSQIVKSGVSEGLEEVAEGLIDPLIDSVTLGKDYEVNGTELLMSFLMAGTSGLLISGAATGGSLINSSIEVGNLVKNNRAKRAEVMGSINNLGQLRVNSREQFNKLNAEVDILKRNLYSMTQQQREVANELIAKADTALKTFSDKSTTMGVKMSYDNVVPIDMESSEQLIYQALEPDFNQEMRMNENLNVLQSQIDEDILGMASKEIEFNNASQAILNENGYNISAETFNSLNEEQQKSTLVALDFARVMGLNVQVVNNLRPGENGFVDGKGNITIDGTKNPVLYTLSHELTHGTESSKYYSDLKQLVVDSFGENWQSEVQKKIADYKQGGINLNLDEAEKEVVARFVENKLGDEQFIDDLIKYNYSIASRIYQDLNTFGDDDVVAQIRNKFEKAFADNYEQNSEKFSTGKSYEEHYNPEDFKYEALTKDKTEYQKISLEGTSLEGVEKNELAKIVKENAINSGAIDVGGQYNFVMRNRNGENVLVNKESLYHAKTVEIPKARLNFYGHIVELFNDAVKINEGYRDGVHSSVYFTEANNNGKPYVVRFVVEDNVLKNYDASYLYAFSAQEKRGTATGSSPFSSSYTYNVAQLLEDINSIDTFKNDLPLDVFYKWNNKYKHNNKQNLEGLKYSFDSNLLNEEFGTTWDFRKAGYILSDGNYLDLSEGQNRRTQDHRSVGVLYDGLDYARDGINAGMIRFMNEGNIRVIPESGGVDISNVVEPTSEQYKKIGDFLQYYREDGFYLDISNEEGRNIASVEYPPFTSYRKVVNDIKQYFEDGTIPETNSDSAEFFRYSYDASGPKEDSRYNELSNQMSDYLKGTKLTDEQGRPLVIFHTSPATFTEFDPRGSSHYRFGDKVVNYFSTDSEVSGSYTNGKYTQFKSADSYTEFEEGNKKLKELNEKIRETEYKYADLFDKKRMDFFDVFADADFMRDVYSAMNELKTYVENVRTNKETYENVNDYIHTVMVANSISDFLDAVTSNINSSGIAYERGETLISALDSLINRNVIFSNSVSPEVAEIVRPLYESEHVRKMNSLLNDMQNLASERRDEVAKLEDERQGYWQYSGAAGRQYVGYGKSLNPYIVEGYVDEIGENANWNTLNRSSNTFKANEIDVENLGNLFDVFNELYSGGKEISKNRIFKTVLENVNEENRNFFINNPLALANMFHSFEKRNIDYIKGERNIRTPQERLATSIHNSMSVPGYIDSEFSKHSEEILPVADEIAKEKGRMFKRTLDIRDAMNRLGYIETEHFSEHDNIETNDVVKAVLAINDYLGEEKYDGVVFRNITDSGSFSGRDIPSDIIALFDSNQFKLMENYWPTESSDIRHSYDVDNANNIEPADPNGPTRVQGEVLDGYGEERTQRFASSNIPKSQIFNEQQQEQVREEIADGKFTYLGLSNKVEVQRAKEWMQRDGVDETFNKFMSNNTPNAKSVVQGEVLLQELAKNKDPRWHDVAVKMADDATVAGQFLQAYSIMQRLSPEGQLMAIRRNLNRMQNDMDNKYGNKAPQLTLNEELMDELRNAKDSKEAENIRERIYSDLNEQVPRTFMDLMDSWRYLAMLGNPRTHIRNIIGNGAFVPAVEIKNAIGTVLENSVGRLMNLDYKTKSVLNPFSEADNKLIELGKQQYEEYKGAIEKGQKYEQRGFSEERKLGRLLNKLSNFNSTALDKEDYFFSKDRYARSFAQFMKANNITVENLTPEMQAKANDYAMLEAQRATYRDANSVAEWLNKLEYGSNKGSKLASYLKKAVIPFTKTPMNIIKRGVRYSPLGLWESVTTGAYQLKKGTITANQFLDNMASGLTGSAIALLGAWLTSMGLFRTKDDDKDRKKYFDSENGEQDYAIDLSPFGINGTYTLDWASPVIMPFAMGAELYNTLKDIESFTDVLNMAGDVSAKVMDPIIETSMLSSLKETLQSYSLEGGRWLGDMVEAVIQSYILQFMPTLGGQIARTIDGVRRTTSPNKGGIDKLMKKIYNKIPWVSQLNEPYINKQGQEEKTEDLGMGWVGRAFLNMVSPGYYSSKDIDKYDEEMYRLYETMGDLEVFPSSTTKSVTFNKENFKFTDKEYTEWHKTRYQTETEYVNDFMDSKAYQNLSDYERVATIADIRSYAQKVAKKEFLESKGYIYTDDKELADSDSKYVYDKQLVNTQGALDNGIELHSYYDYLNNAGSKQAEKIAYLENTDLSKKQKEYLYNLSDYKASYSDAYAKAMKNTTNSSSKSKKSSSGSKKSSSASISIDKVSGGGSGKTLNMKAPLVKEEKVSNDNNLSDAYFNAYSRSMKNVSQASGQTIVCPNCHNQVVPYNGRCPICGNPL